MPQKDWIPAFARMMTNGRKELFQHPVKD